MRDESEKREASNHIRQPFARRDTLSQATANQQIAQPKKPSRQWTPLCTPHVDPTRQHGSITNTVRYRMRLSAEILGQAEQRPNPLGERELLLRGLAIPNIEHLAVTRDAFDSIDFSDNRLLRLENFPRLNRLKSLILPGNLIESIDFENMKKNTPNITSLMLSHNRVSSLHEVANLGKACPKLEFLSLFGNPVTSKYSFEMVFASPEHSRI